MNAPLPPDHILNATPPAPVPPPSDASGGFTALFVRRPVLATVVNALIVVAGLAAFFGIEIRELPDVDRPVITVRTDFEGASPETVDQQLTTVIEGAVSRVAGLQSLSSQSSFGSSRVTLEFSSDTDLDVAASDIRNAISRSENSLPEDADPPQIVKADSDSQAIMRLAVTSTSQSLEDLTALVDDTIADQLAAVGGVADVETYGGEEKVFRIDINQTALAARGLTVADISTTLGRLAIDMPAGSLASNTQSMAVRASAVLETPEDFARILLKDNVRLGDVAAVSLGPQTGTTILRTNGLPGVGLGIIRQAQSNTLDISDGVRATVDRLSKTLPEGTVLRITSDDAQFIRGSIHEVEIALVASSVIVVFIIFLFLRDWKATLIPAITLPVALSGTLAAIYLAGFSINILTLLAIVLATGLVVDDAIVVLENIVRRRNMGLGPRAAAVLGTKQVFFAVMATTLTLAAVFVPLSFLPGQVGGLFREFGYVLAFSVLLSSFVALSLCPMLASRLLKQNVSADDPRSLCNRVGGAFSRFYARTLHACLAGPAIVMAVSVLLSAAAYGLFVTLPQELTPREDRAAVLLRVQAPDGVSLDYMREQMRQVEEAIEGVRQPGEIASVFSITGQGGSTNSGFMVLTLAPWGERERSQDLIAGDINRALAGIPGVRAQAIQANSLRIRGAGNGLQFALVGNDREAVTRSATAVLTALQESGLYDNPRLGNDISQAQLSVNIDRTRAEELGIAVDGLGPALQSLLTGRSIGDVFVKGKSIPVLLSATAQPINDPGDLENLFLKTKDGRIVPLSSIATLSEKPVAPQLSREQQQAAVSITAGLKDSMPLGVALSEAERIADPLLENGVRIMPLAEAATLNENAGSMAVTFGFAILVILLVLAAQFESVVSALIIMVTVPLGLACAVLALWFTGSTLNIYSQIGLILLTGIMAKNGILIVEFANQLRDEGHSVREAIVEACAIRLRPVMMTMIATILGGVPLVFAQGAGAEARVALGWVIVGGLGLAAIVTLYVTPVVYLLMAGLSKPHADEERRLHEELDAAHRLEQVPAE